MTTERELRERYSSEATRRRAAAYEAFLLRYQEISRQYSACLIGYAEFERLLEEARTERRRIAWPSDEGLES